MPQEKQTTRPAEQRRWHAVSAEDVLSHFEAHPERGLDPAEVERRQGRFGPNVLPPRKGRGAITSFLLQFHQALVYILIVCGLVSAAFTHWVEAGVIFGVVLVNAVVGFVQERKATKALAALARTMTTTATVIRGGQLDQVGSEQLVVGDVVVLNSGDKVPADLRLFYARDLQVNESALTGESLPVAKQGDTLAAETLLADRANMAYSSLLVTYGRGRGVVVATGRDTEMSRISELIATADELTTPLTRSIAHFSRVLFFVILACAAVTFIVGCLWGKDWIYMFQAAVALAVGAVPEALPAAVTVTLAIGAGRMARRHAIIRKLPAVETLGSTSVICSDKTGTLTENQLTVREIWAGARGYEVSGTGFAPFGEITAEEDAGAKSAATEGAGPDGAGDPLENNQALAACLTAGLLCNDAVLEEQNGRWQVQGDPTEGALVVSARKAGLSREELAGRLPKTDAIPFESENMYSATLHDPGNGKPLLVMLKGAVETVLARSTRALDEAGRPVPLDAKQVRAQFEQMAARGLRVLAFARGELPPGTQGIGHSDVDTGLTFLGLQGMIDPPRPEAIAAVRTCQRAGIRVKMITGDHPLNAAVTARKLGLNSQAHPNGDLVVLSGDELSALSDEELIDVADRASVFARVTPEEKLRLVRAYQARHHIVAMTGDGVNDAPALRQADIGVAMGVGGTDVAKEAADMVLTDDNFATIEAAVEEGRGVFDSLTKFIVWTLPTNLGDGLLIMAAVLAGLELPITPLQVLWINMTTVVLLGLVLAFEPKEPGIMLRNPRNPREPIITRALVGRIVLVGLVLLGGAFGLFRWFVDRGLAAGRPDELVLAEARTVAANFFVFVQLFYVFNCRSLTRSMAEVGVFSNPWVWIGVGSMIGLQIVFTHAPVMNTLFRSAPIGYEAWLWVLTLSFLIYPLVGAEKWVRRTLDGGASA